MSPRRRRAATRLLRQLPFALVALPFFVAGLLAALAWAGLEEGWEAFHSLYQRVTEER